MNLHFIRDGTQSLRLMYPLEKMPPFRSLIHSDTKAERCWQINFRHLRLAVSVSEKPRQGSYILIQVTPKCQSR